MSRQPPIDLNDLFSPPKPALQEQEPPRPPDEPLELAVEPLPKLPCTPRTKTSHKDRSGNLGDKQGYPGGPNGIFKGTGGRLDRSTYGANPNNPEIKKVSYSHDAVMDQLLANPMLTMKELATMFGFSAQWIRRVVNSDAFQARLAERKAQLIDPLITSSVEERMRAVVNLSLEILDEKLEATRDPKLAIKSLEVCQRAAGYGAKTTVEVNNSFVVAMPEKAPSEEAWAAKYAEAAEAIFVPVPEDKP